MTDITKVSQPKAGRPLDEKVTKGAGGTNVAFRPFENSVYETGGLVRLLDELALIERSLFRGREGMISEKAKDFITGGAVLFFGEVEKLGLEPAGDAKQLAFIRDLVSYLRSLPVVRITLAFAPTNTFLQNLSVNISGVVGTKTLVDLVINEYIVGGAIIEFRGRVYRQTLDSSLDDVLKREVGTLAGK